MSTYKFHKDGIIPTGDWIFVFGSNLKGAHGKGAAKIARVNKWMRRLNSLFFRQSKGAGAIVTKQGAPALSKKPPNAFPAQAVNSYCG